jgi:signal transduction histidine kinase
MKNFRIKSSILIIALVGLLGYNILCLTTLYRKVETQTKELIAQSLRDADLDEVLNRYKRYPAPDSAVTYKGKSLSQSRSIEGDTLMVYVTDGSGDVVEVRKEPLDPGTNYSDIMVSEIGYGAHQTVDPIFSLRIADMDSLFRLSLARKGIDTHIATVLSVDGQGCVKAGNIGVRQIESLDSVSVCYNMLTGDRYVAYYSSPHRYVFRQMSGIVISTVALIILIAISFIYLLRTVSRLRTIEEMKDDFVGNMTHELKTPISIAYSANDALLNYDTTNDPEKKEAYLSIAMKQLKRLGELVENILAMSMERRKTMTLKPERIELPALVDEIAAAQRMRGDKEISIEIQSEEEVAVTADKSHLSNVLNNLIDNAIKYSGESVAIKIRLSADEMEVADNGIGIPAKSLPYIFDKFYRVPHGNRQDVRGYGIGLYYVKQILEKMGWSISVRSQEGHGSVFTIKFSSHES